MEEEVNVDFESLVKLNIIVKDLEEEVYNLNKDFSVNLVDLTEEEIESKIAVLKVSINALITNVKNVERSVLNKPSVTTVMEGRRMYSEK